MSDATQKPKLSRIDLRDAAWLLMMRAAEDMERAIKARSRGWREHASWARHAAEAATLSLKLWKAAG